MSTPFLLSALLGGLALLGVGNALDRRDDVREAGMSPVALLLKGAGLAVLSVTLFRFVRWRLGV